MNGRPLSRSYSLSLVCALMCFEVVHGSAAKEVILAKLAKWSAASGKEVRFVKEL